MERDMFAIFVDGGRQYRVTSGQRLRVDYRGEEVTAGTELKFEQVLCAGNNSDNKIGRPALADSVVTAEVIRHEKGEKLDIVQYKRRKNQRRHIGHRQKHTVVQIKSISVPGLPEDAPTESAPAAT